MDTSDVSLLAELAWQTPEMRRGRDVYKAGCALKNGKTVIRIQQEDVFSIQSIGKLY